MDDRRFDQLVKAVASGASRRSVLKGMLGLGGAALVGGAALEPDAKAARRPTPTPKPPSCPGQQTPVGGQCICQVPKAPGPNKCGPDCCTGLTTDPYPRPPGHSECCDNACCFGTCYGEELCCPTNDRPGGLPPLAGVCLATNECCLAPDFCCNIDGCCSTVCWGGNFDDDFCCPAEDLCPGGGTSPDLCCTGDTFCCGAGTDENGCIELSDDDTCCAASDCGPPAEGTCGWVCSANQCFSIFCFGGYICCEGACVSSSAYEVCPADSDQCCDSETDVCCGGACCARNRCNAGQQCCGQSQFVCGQSCCDAGPGALCCGGNTCCVDGKCAGGVTCCTGSDVACVDGCCPPERCVAGEGCCDEGDIACGEICCPSAGFFCNDQQQCECHPGTEPCSQLPGPCCPVGQCNNDFFCCPGGTSPCAEDCCDNATQTCNLTSGACECTGGAILCGGACIFAECCGSDTSACASLGYDPECVLCVNGDCTDGGTEFLPCSTFDIPQGWCNNGFCTGCLSNGVGCDESSQCCSNNCVQGTCELD